MVNILVEKLVLATEAYVEIYFSIVNYDCYIHLYSNYLQEGSK